MNRNYRFSVSATCAKETAAGTHLQLTLCFDRFPET